MRQILLAVWAKHKTTNVYPVVGRTGITTDTPLGGFVKNRKPIAAQRSRGPIIMPLSPITGSPRHDRL